MIEFKDKFTLDGLLVPAKGVTKESVAKVATLIGEGKRGNYVSEAKLKESLMTGVLANSVAHFINVITIPQLPEVNERPVAALAGRRSLPDFRPATLYSIFGKLDGPGITDAGGAVTIPQGTPFPEVTITGVESAYSKLAKNGFRINWDFEDFVNDTIGVLDGIPAEMRDIALQTEWNEVGDALIKATTKQGGAVVLPDGTSVPNDAKISANAIMAGIQSIGLRTINGAKRKIGTLSGYNVVVATGQKVFVDYMIKQALSGLYVLPGSGGGVVMPPPDNSVLASVNVIEHDSVKGTKWYLLPKPGAFSRPVLDVLNLRGYETPQIRVRTEGGDGFSFDADTAAMRLRLVTGGALWFQEAVLYSAGTAS